MQAGAGEMEEGTRHVTSWASGNTKSKERRERYHSYKTGPKAKGRFCYYMQLVVVVCSGLTSLSTVFQSYHEGVWLRQGVQCSLL